MNGIITPTQVKPFIGVIIGDSLSLPRYKAGINIEDTYCYRLGNWWRERYGSTLVWPLSKGGATIKALTADFRAFLPYIKPQSIDAAIVHLGVVDCAPRPLPYQVRNLLGMTPPFIRDRITKYLHNNRGRLFKLGISFRFTNPKQFRRAYQGMLQTLSAESARIYVINISPATEATYNHSPNLFNSIYLYNDIIRQVVAEFKGVRLIDNYSKMQDNRVDSVAEDIHMSKQGHDYIFEQISSYEEMV